MWSAIKGRLREFWAKFREEWRVLWRLCFSIGVFVLLGRFFTTITGLAADFGNVLIYSVIGAVVGGVFYGWRTLRNRRHYMEVIEEEEEEVATA